MHSIWLHKGRWFTFLAGSTWSLKFIPLQQSHLCMVCPKVCFARSFLLGTWKKIDPERVESNHWSKKLYQVSVQFVHIQCIYTLRSPVHAMLSLICNPPSFDHLRWFLLCFLRQSCYSSKKQLRGSCKSNTQDWYHHHCTRSWPCSNDWPRSLRP